MLAAERRKRILDLVNRDGGIGSTAVADLLKTSLPTIRRDLEMLARQRLILRTHGGAISHSRSTAYEPPHLLKLQLHAEAKERIGKAAAALIVENDTMIFDAGSTCLQVARHAPEVRFTALTLDLPIAAVLAERPHVEVHVIGGRVRRGFYSFVGSFTEEVLRKIHVNRLFLGADGVHTLYGVTNGSVDEVPVKRLAIQSAQEVVLVADSSKFQTKALMHVCPIGAIHHVITDRGVRRDIVRTLRRKQIRVTVV